MYFGKIIQSLGDKAKEILRGGVSQICKIKGTIFSKEDANITIDLMQVDTWNVIQLFEKEFHDQVTITLNVSVEEAMLLLTNYKNLRLTVKLDHVTQHYYQLIDEIPQEVHEFVVIIKNPTDLLKELQKTELTTTKEESTTKSDYQPDSIRSKRYGLQVELMEEKLSNFRTTPFNCLGSQCNVLAVILGALAAVDIKGDEIEIIRKPDNARIYTAIPIPPMQTLQTVFDLLHDTYGLYKTGTEYYYTNKKMYIYSGYDTNPPTERVVHLYRLPENSYPGDCKYHTVDEGGNVHIVLQDPVNITNLAEKSIDVNGNYQIARRSDAGLDVDITMNGKDATVRGNNLMTMAAQNENQSQPGSTSAKYVPTTNNALAMSSNMAAAMCKYMTSTWQFAWPWLLTPGMKVMYHYEDMNGLKTTTGILSCIEYALSKVDGTIGKHNSYAWAAQFGVRLSPDEVTETKIEPDMLSTFKALA
jgi:hypothetical protein